SSSPRTTGASSGSATPDRVGPAVVRGGIGSPTMDTGSRLASPTGRGIVVAAVLGSGVALLDGTVVNVALPHIGEYFRADLDTLQWTINGYTLTLAAIVLLGGALGDRFGRRRVFLVGVVWFGVASVLCGLAPGPVEL